MVPFNSKNILKSVAALSHIPLRDLESDLDEDEQDDEYVCGSWCRVQSSKDDDFEVFVYPTWEEVVKWHAGTIRVDIENEDFEELPLRLLEDFIPLVVKRCDLGELSHWTIATGRDLVYLGDLAEEDFPRYCKDSLKALREYFDDDDKEFVTTLISQCRPDLSGIAEDVLKSIGGIGYYIGSSILYFKTSEGFYVAAETKHVIGILGKHAKPVDCSQEGILRGSVSNEVV
jgi:hypothetical protein